MERYIQQYCLFLYLRICTINLDGSVVSCNLSGICKVAIVLSVKNCTPATVCLHYLSIELSVIDYSLSLNLS